MFAFFLDILKRTYDKIYSIYLSKYYLNILRVHAYIYLTEVLCIASCLSDRGMAM